MKTFKFIALSAMAVCALSANAQFANTGKSKGGSSKAGSVLVNDCESYNRFYIGYSALKPRMGSNYSDVTKYVDSYNDDLKALGGFKLGYLKGVSLSENLPLFLEVGAEFALNTSSNYVVTGNGIVCDSHSAYDDFRSTSVAIDVPFSLAYKLGFANGLYVEPYAGIRARINVIGKTLYTGTNSDELNWYDDGTTQMGKDNAFRRFQFGGQFGVNLGYKAINLNIGYDMYSPIWKSDESGTDSYFKFNTRNFNIGLGYNF